MKVHSERRPWGRFEKFHENKPCTVKLIHVDPDSRLSLQYHKNRTELWKVIRGTAFVQLEDDSLILGEGDTLVIPRKAKHRLGARAEGCVILEITYGRFSESDIVRIEDDYKRAPAIAARTSVAG